MNAPPEFIGVLARALLKAPNHKLALLPAGEATHRGSGKRNTAAANLTEYRITGLGFMPQSIWLDARREYGGVSLELVFRSISLQAKPWFLNCRKRKTRPDERGPARVAHEVTRIPKSDLIIRARAFSIRAISALLPGTVCLVRGDRIVRVVPDAEVKAGCRCGGH